MVPNLHNAETSLERFSVTVQHIAFSSYHMWQMGTLEIFFIFIIYCSNKAAQGDLCQTNMVQENTSTFLCHADILLVLVSDRFNFMTYSLVFVL